MKTQKLQRRTRRNYNGAAKTAESKTSGSRTSNSRSSGSRGSSSRSSGSTGSGSRSYSSRGSSSRNSSGRYKLSGSRNFNRRSRSNKKKSNEFDVVTFINQSQAAQTKMDKNPAPEVVIKHTFSDFDLPESMKNDLKSNGFITPTEIQDTAIPPILEGRDLVGIANTGTGKTLAFVLPIASMIINAGRGQSGKRKRALIMCPTRELAQQVEAEVAKLTNESPIYSLVCVGGMPIGRQIRKLKQRPEFVIGTPGRLKDLLDRGVLDLSEFEFAVLDEADQMLDMGFVNDMRYILDHFHTNHQTLLFSATMSDEIKSLVSDFTKNALVVSVKRRETAITVDQSTVSPNHNQSKSDLLKEILDRDNARKTIVFCRTKRGVDTLVRELRAADVNAEAIHGDKPQRVRTRILDRFRAHSITVLVATDVAARGLDVDDITHVINYDIPQTQDDYVHRIGRTGRAGKEGVAITFV